MSLYFKHMIDEVARSTNNEELIMSTIYSKNLIKKLVKPSKEKELDKILLNLNKSINDYLKDFNPNQVNLNLNSFLNDYKPLTDYSLNNKKESLIGIIQEVVNQLSGIEVKPLIYNQLLINESLIKLLFEGVNDEVTCPLCNEKTKVSFKQEINDGSNIIFLYIHEKEKHVQEVRLTEEEYNDLREYYLLQFK